MSQIFFSAKDRRFLANRQRNFYREVLSPVDVFFPNSPIPEEFVDIYRESPSTEQLLDNTTQHNIPCHLLFEPPESEWKAEGIDEPRTIKLSFSRKVLDEGYLPDGEDEKVPFPYPKRGCLVIAEDRLYYITEIRLKHYHGNTEEWYTRVCWGVRHHPNSIVDDEQVEPGTERPPVEIVW